MRGSKGQQEGNEKKKVRGKKEKQERKTKGRRKRKKKKPTRLGRIQGTENKETQ